MIPKSCLLAFVWLVFPWTSFWQETSGICLGQQFSEADRYLLTSATQSIEVPTWQLSGKAWKVTKQTMHGGRQEGVQLITLDNGKLKLQIVPTRGMSIYRVQSDDIRLGWDSPVPELVHPAHIDLADRGGLGWLEGFNEWLVRCGLEYAGHPGTDEFINNTGETAKLDLTLHGKIGNIPASEVEVVVDRQAPYRIRVRGTVYEKFFYGPKLKLVTEVSVVPGEDRFQILDQVTNLGASEQEFQLIYHANFGAPLLEADSRAYLAARKVGPMNEHAAEGIDQFDVYAGPTSGFVEQVYLMEPYADATGHSAAVLSNAAGTKAASMRWQVNQLPYLTLWKNTAAKEDGYVTGIEPATGYPYNRKVEREAGRVPKLAAGATREFSLEIGLHHGEAAVKAAVEQVQAIRGGRPTELQKTPVTGK